MAAHRQRRVAARPELRGVADPAAVDAGLSVWEDTDADRALYVEVAELVARSLAELEAEMDGLYSREGS